MPWYLYRELHYVAIFPITQFIRSPASKLVSGKA